MNSEQKGFTIGLCTAGKRELRISGRTWEIVPGCLFILLPQQFTEDISCSGDFSARTLSASLEAILEHPSPDPAQGTSVPGLSVPLLKPSWSIPARWTSTSSTSPSSTL